jgi:putative acetyltransferase
MINEPPRQTLLTLRQATLDDLDEIKQLFTDTLNAVCTNDYDADQLAIWSSTAQNTHRWHDAVYSQYFPLAMVDDEIAGFGSLDNGRYIDFMYVHKNHQRQGIAETLMEILIAEAYKCGTRTVTSDVSITARPFFEKMGFIMIREQVNLRKGIEIINYKMAKELID